MQTQKITIDQALRIAALQHISMIAVYAEMGNHFVPWYADSSRLQFVQDYRQFKADWQKLKADNRYQS